MNRFDCDRSLINRAISIYPNTHQTGKPPSSSNLTTSLQTHPLSVNYSRKGYPKFPLLTISSPVSMPASVPNKMCVVCWCVRLMPSISDLTPTPLVSRHYLGISHVRASQWVMRGNSHQ
ncbi:hypothetical protein CEXT_198401 [Caerostris extrusa]|uniref:Uncharacterized protein n=1 Tax=Caerostris extrusa TaxID=172846 RepID=A0AAV4R447_CAEEX|nr:hypothetical protein CEXT_198401 [Caerostris extrusa]